MDEFYNDEKEDRLFSCCNENVWHTALNAVSYANNKSANVDAESICARQGASLNKNSSS